MPKATVHIAAFFSMFFWGISYVWSKVVFEFYSPITTIFFRLLISVLVLFIFMKFTGQLQLIKRKDLGLLVISAFFNPFLYFVGESFGLKLVSASVSAFIVATIPVFTPVFAFWFLKERLKPLSMVGLIVSFIGVLFIILRIDFSLSASPLGIGLLFLAVCSAIIYAIILKKLVISYNPVSLIAWQELVGVLYFLPLFLYFDVSTVWLIQPSTNAILSLLALGFFASAIAYVLYTFVLKNMTLSKANIYVNLIPVFAAVTAYFVLDEIFTPVKVIGMILVIFGVVLSQFRGWNTRKSKNSLDEN